MVWLRRSGAPCFTQWHSTNDTFHKGEKGRPEWERGLRRRHQKQEKNATGNCGTLLRLRIKFSARGTAGPGGVPGKCLCLPGTVTFGSDAGYADPLLTLLGATVSSARAAL